MEDKYINVLLKLADRAYKKAESPIAAIIVLNGKIIAKSYNKRNSNHKTTSHAEIEVINIANRKLKNWRLPFCSLYVTVKPCEMCETVIKEARISEVFYLVDRNINKKQFNKTKFSKINTEDSENLEKKYLKKLKKFWENKR